MRCYFAHPVTDYGGTKRQIHGIQTIQRIGWIVVNPDSPLHQAIYKEVGMAHFIELVEGCDDLAFMRFPNGKIGAGVEKEISAALAAGIPVWDIDNGFVRTTMMPSDVMTVEETRAEILAIRKSATSATAVFPQPMKPSGAPS